MAVIETTNRIGHSMGSYVWLADLQTQIGITANDIEISLFYLKPKVGTISNDWFREVESQLGIVICA